MKSNKIALIWISLIFILTGTSGAQTLNLQDFLTMVKRHSKDLKIAAREKELANVNKREAIATALPRVAVQANYTRNLNPFFLYADMSAMFGGQGGITKFKIKRNNEYSATAALQQTLFSPTVGNAIKAARQYQKLTDFIYNASQQKILTAAKKMFYQALLLEKLTRVRQEAERNALDNYKNMQLKFNNGMVSEFELLQAEVRWKNSIPETAKAKRNYEIALNNLKQWAAIPIETRVTLAGNFDNYPDLPEKVSLSTILKNRPDFNALLWEKRLRMTNLNAKRAAFFPTLTGTFAYNFSAQSDYWKIEQENHLYFAAVNLSLPLFTGGYRSAEVQKAKIEIDKTIINIEKMKERIYNEVANIYLRLNEAHQRIASAKSTLKAAEKAFKIAENTAKSGLATQLQLKDARVAFDMAKTNFYAAIFDYLAAYFDWEAAVGKEKAE